MILRKLNIDEKIFPISMIYLGLPAIFDQSISEMECRFS